MLRPLAPLAEAVYRRVITGRNAAFDAGRGVVTIDRPVVSVGNLTVGGTGKTPIVTAVIAALLDAGHTPAIAMRGYKARGGVSDEAASYARRFEGLPVVARPDRLEGLLDLFSRPEGEAVDVVVLDDGFQHRRLARQLDIVAIDAAARPSVFEERLLPRGWLREGPASLARAHAVVLTHADRADRGEVDALSAACLRVNGSLALAEAAHGWSTLDVHEGDDRREEPVASLRGRRVVAVCGVGRPERFLEQVGTSGADVAGQVIMQDHAPFTPPVRRGIVRLLREAGCRAIVTTDKDWSRLRPHAMEFDAAIIRPRLELRWLRGGDAVLDRVRATAGEPEIGARPGC